MLTKNGVAHLAAGFVTNLRGKEVAGRYLEWMDSKDDEGAAADALIASARTSANPDKVLAAADTMYDEFAGEANEAEAGEETEKKPKRRGRKAKQEEPAPGPEAPQEEPETGSEQANEGVSEGGDITPEEAAKTDAV